MARCCGSTGTCACKIEGGRNITIKGMGSSQDPFVVEANVALEVEDSPTFDVGLTGNGTQEFPWLIAIRFANGATIDALPDVNVGELEERTNGYVIGWDEATAQFTLRAPTTAAAGSVLTDASLTGDGSAGTPLSAQTDEARYVEVGANGIGLTDTGLQRIVRRYADETQRAAATPAPDPNSLSVLDSNPGQVDYWDGSEWLPIQSAVGLSVQSDALLELSGAYDGGPVVEYVNRITLVTAADGSFDALPTSELLTYGGVLSIHVQPTGNGTPWTCMAVPTVDRIVGRAIRVDNGAALAGAQITAEVRALLY
jgi:hypothetical protein